MDFGDNLKRVMEIKKYSIRRLAQKTGISQTAIYYYRKGERVPNVYVACDLADALGVNIRELLGR